MFLGFYPGYHGGVLHRRIAQRLAWRKRVALGFFLLLLGAVLALLTGERAGLLLPLAALLYPARREEARALTYLDRFGLAYRAWLEADPGDPLYPELARAAEAQAQRVRPPRFPLLGLAALLVLWAALGLWAPSGPGAPEEVARPAAAPERPRPAGGAAPAPEEPPEEAGKAASPSTSPRSRARPGEEAGKKGAETPEGTMPETARPAPGTAKDRPRPGEEAGPEGAGRRLPGGAESGSEAAEGAPPEDGKALGRAASGSAAKGAPAWGAGPGDSGVPPVPPPEPAAGERLPSPWPKGRPPEAVRRRAADYLEAVPLTPAQRRVLEAYFGLSESSP